MHNDIYSTSVIKYIMHKAGARNEAKLIMLYNQSGVVVTDLGCTTLVSLNSAGGF